jgi:hypothetical protein
MSAAAAGSSRHLPVVVSGTAQIYGRTYLTYLYLSTGIRGKTVTDISPRLLTQHEGLRGRFLLDVTELAQ